MKKLLISAFLLSAFNINAQKLIVAENINDGLTSNTLTGEDLCSDNSIRVEINLKKKIVTIVNFGETRIYKIDKAEDLKEGYYYIYCSSPLYQNIELMTGGLGLSVFYNETLSAHAEYPLSSQLKHIEKLKHDKNLNDNGTFSR